MHLGARKGVNAKELITEIIGLDISAVVDHIRLVMFVSPERLYLEKFQASLIVHWHWLARHKGKEVLCSAMDMELEALHEELPIQPFLREAFRPRVR